MAAKYSFDPFVCLAGFVFEEYVAPAPAPADADGDVVLVVVVVDVDVDFVVVVVVDFVVAVEAMAVFEHFFLVSSFRSLNY